MASRYSQNALVLVGHVNKLDAGIIFRPIPGSNLLVVRDATGQGQYGIIQGDLHFMTGILARGVGMKIIYYQRHKAPADWEKGTDAEYRTTLKQLVKEADFISINVPYGPPTEKMFNLEILSSMKPSAFLISNSRGGIVDEGALYDVLKERRIAGAALDVYRWEPVPSDCPLLKLDNVLWATHNGGGANEFILQENHDVLANISRVARGDKPEFMI